MDVQAEKLDLIQWLAQLKDEEMIAKIKALRDNKSDWWDRIAADEKAEIEEGLAQADRGLLRPHAEVRKNYEGWL
jgi:predicted transcriptional regulator